jgi:uncharacterized protein Yka (UPF0111/DUF47 family)
MNEDKLIDAVVRAVSGLEDSMQDGMISLRSELKTEMSTNTDRMIAAFNRLGETIAKKMDESNAEVKGLREDLKKYQDLADRVKKIEERLDRMEM